MDSCENYPVRKKKRLTGFDYSSPNAYFITICTHQRQKLFWTAVGATIVAQMKGAVTKQVGTNVWQKGFHDHVVRTTADFQEIWAYIDANPYRWETDSLYIP